MSLTDRLPAPTSRGASAALFAPRTLLGLDLPNAFVMAPMTRFRSPDGVPDATVADYYGRRAAGGIGLVITEGILVDHPSAGAEPDAPRLAPPASAAGWTRVVDRVHAEGSRVIAQLWHQGSERESADGGPVWTPSGRREDGTVVGEPVTVEEIAHLITTYADAAAAAYDAGFDGVEVHAAHGYLLDEFLWARTNHRTDAYGGSPAARARIVAEIVAAVRAATAPDWPISVRFSQFKERDFGARIAQTPAELAAVLTPIVEAGADLWHASARRFWEPAFAGSPLTLAGWAKELTGLPAIAVGSLGLTADATQRGEASLGAAARLHEAGELDLIALGRPLLANPRWVEHVRAERLADNVAYAKAHEEIYP